MSAIVLALLKKAAPYLVLATIGCCAGFYFGYNLGANGLSAAKLAVSEQQTNDAKAVAVANSAAAAALAKGASDANAAELALATADTQGRAEETNLTSQIAAQAAQPGQDAPDAPVLRHALDALEGSQ